ncbi:hypothetical protein [Nitrospirillum pindoramense]|uniref:Uncharacterized protein n=1 Tax=Nitrospirillum amazonense TaxID=28077 RepID=A0A560GQ74_9PROT|nr:hypothetical protein [Nitrospirillum amazonense]TWB35809.1 hypothetical protein FBZ90_1189 [Nitrospirillum amazonense]
MNEDTGQQLLGGAVSILVFLICLLGLGYAWEWMQMSLAPDSPWFCAAPSFIGRLLFLLNMAVAFFMAGLAGWIVARPRKYRDEKVLRSKTVRKVLWSLLPLGAVAFFLSGTRTCLVDGGIYAQSSYLSAPHRYTRDQVRLIIPHCDNNSRAPFHIAIALKMADGRILHLESPSRNPTPGEPTLADLLGAPVDWSDVPDYCPSRAITPYLPDTRPGREGTATP